MLSAKAFDIIHEATNVYKLPGYFRRYTRAELMEALEYMEQEGSRRTEGRRGYIRIELGLREDDEDGVRPWEETDGKVFERATRKQREFVEQWEQVCASLRERMGYGADIE